MLHIALFVIISKIETSKSKFSKIYITLPFLTSLVPHYIANLTPIDASSRQYLIVCLEVLISCAPFLLHITEMVMMVSSGGMAPESAGIGRLLLQVVVVAHPRNVCSWRNILPHLSPFNSHLHPLPNTQPYTPKPPQPSTTLQKSSPPNLTQW